MYKLLIVDDELLIREGLSAMIDWQSLALQSVGSAADGLEAYEMILQYQPDIVLTDIRMPEIDGLSLIEKSLSVFPNLKFILLSGFDDFEYAHTAMRFGVRHYLLKPSSNQELNSALQSVIQELNQHREAQTKLLHLTAKTDEQIFRQFLLEGDYGRQEWNYYQKKYLSSTNSGLMLLISLPDANDALYFYALQNMLVEILGAHTISSKCKIENDLILLVHSLDERQLRNLLEKVYVDYKNFYHQSLTIVLKKYTHFSELPPMVHKIQTLLKESPFFYQDKILQERDLLFYEYNQTSSVNYDFSELIEVLNHQSLSSALDLLDAYFNGFRQKRYSKTAIQLFLLTLINSLFSQIRDEERLPFFEKLLPLLHSNQPPALHAELRSMIEYIWRAKHESTTGYSAVIQQMIQQIESRLADPDLSLKFLANHVLFMNKDYLGKQFKRETGQSFSEYLTHVRMEKAIDLIINLKIEQIGQIPAMIGYKNNPSYFQRLFKNHTGKTPYQYKKLVSGKMS